MLEDLLVQGNLGRGEGQQAKIDKNAQLMNSFTVLYAYSTYIQYNILVFAYLVGIVYYYK